jgi:hypothetical protein
MGLERRFKKTDKIAFSRLKSILITYNLGIYATNCKCTKTYALKKNYAQRFKACKYFYLSRYDS